MTKTKFIEIQVGCPDCNTLLKEFDYGALMYNEPKQVMGFYCDKCQFVYFENELHEKCGI